MRAVAVAVLVDVDGVTGHVPLHIAGYVTFVEIGVVVVVVVDVDVDVVVVVVVVVDVDVDVVVDAVVDVDVVDVVDVVVVDVVVDVVVVVAGSLRTGSPSFPSEQGTVLGTALVLAEQWSSAVLTASLTLGRPPFHWAKREE